MLKRFLALGAAVLLALSLSACGAPAEQLETLVLPEELEASQISGAEDAEPAATPKPSVKQEDCEDSLEGLCKYLEGNNAVAGEKAEMSYKEIGAAGGFRYKFRFHNSTVQVEVYEFDTGNLDEKGKDCWSSAKEKGFITVLEKKVPVVLSPNEKYLLIYTDTREEEANKAQQETVTKLFQGFYA